MSDIARQTADLDATDLAYLVREGDVTALELIDAAIARLESVNGSLNAVVTPMYELARESAKVATSDGPFSGVPFLMKDFLAEVKGVRFTEGSRFLGEFVPNEDSELVKRFRAAGLHFIGKTNAPELAIGATTEPARFGATHNPWDLTRTPGGSSGGAAAAVAARVVPMAHGNDAGGSIRIPASCCGLVGLKPSRARVTLGPHYGDLFGGIVAELAVTRSVRDTATLLDAVAGPMTGEPYLAPPATGTFASALEQPPQKLRIGFSAVTPLGDPVDSECEKAVRDAAKLCEDLGHIVEECAPDYDAFNLWTHLTTMLFSGIAWAQADWSRRLNQPLTPQLFEPFVWAFAEKGRQLSAAEYLLAVQDLQLEIRRYSRFFDDYDLWLTPTLGQPPVALGTLSYDGDPMELRRRTAKFSPFTYISNATGQPAISVPLHWTPDNLPVGVHFVARMGAEETLLGLAASLEMAKPWAAHRPPTAADGL